MLRHHLVNLRSHERQILFQNLNPKLTTMAHDSAPGRRVSYG